MTARKQKKDAADNTTMVYCGPTIPGVAKQFTFYRDGLPAALEAVRKETPTLDGLIVSLEELPLAMRQLRMGTGLLFNLYRTVQEKR